MIVGDLRSARLQLARSFGCETIDISKGDLKDQIEQILPRSLGSPPRGAGVHGTPNTLELRRVAGGNLTLRPPQIRT